MEKIPNHPGSKRQNVARDGWQLTTPVHGLRVTGITNSVNRVTWIPTAQSVLQVWGKTPSARHKR